MYTVVNGTTHQLFAYNTVDGATTPVFPAGTIYNDDGSWSPDGKRFCCTLSLKKTNGGGLYSFDFIENNLGKEPVLREVAQYVPAMYGKQLASIDLTAIDSTDRDLYNAFSVLKNNQQYLEWSPDGKWIATITPGTSYGWIIPSGGGVPIDVADFSHSIFYKGYELTGFEQPLLKAFSGDSQEILYQGQIIDEARGTVVTITDEIDSEGVKHFGWSVTGPTIPAMKALNIFTGETRTIMDGAYSGFYSHDGKYFVYQSYPSKNIVLYETNTGQSRILADRGTPCCFSGDDSYLLACVSTEDGIVKIPLDGGNSETLLPGPVSWANLSPDGRFVLYTTTNGSTWTLAVMDLVSGKRSLVMPFNEDFICSIGASNNVFSPDGKSLCYGMTSKTAASWTRPYTREFNPADYFSSTGVETAAPAAFALLGNYPNPFNPSTTIQFSLKTAGKVNLSVYNAAGQKIRELVPNAVMTPGVHHVLWDGRDDSGRPVSSGVYFTRLGMGDRSLAGRMVLLK
jgi:Tol biopolymer transport system component